jgi:hypothetical protein
MLMNVGDNRAITWAGRAERQPGEENTGICAGDVNGDGLLDLFLTNHGRNALLIGRDLGRFDDESVKWNLAQRGRYEGCAFGDIDNDGRIDLVVHGAAEGDSTGRAYIMRNTGERFIDVTPASLMNVRNVQGVSWIDVDRDGDIDLVMSGADTPLFESKLDSAAGMQSLAIRVRDVQDFMTLTGAEVRVFAGSGDHRLLGTRIVDGGESSGSQNDIPLHFGLPNVEEVDVEVTYPRGDRRIQLRIQAISLQAYRGRVLTLRVPPEVRR